MSEPTPGELAAMVGRALANGAPWNETENARSALAALVALAELAERAEAALRDGVRIASQYLDTGRGDLDGWIERARREASDE